MPVYRYRGTTVDSVFLGGQEIYFNPGSNVDIPNNIASMPYITRLISRMLLVPVVGGSGPDGQAIMPITTPTPTPAPTPTPTPTPTPDPV